MRELSLYGFHRAGKDTAILEKQHDYVAEVKKALEEKGVRVEADLRNEKIGYKIREAQLEKCLTCL